MEDPRTPEQKFNDMVEFNRQARADVETMKTKAPWKPKGNRKQRRSAMAAHRKNRKKLKL